MPNMSHDDKNKYLTLMSSESEHVQKVRALHKKAMDDYLANPDDYKMKYATNLADGLQKHLANIRKYTAICQKAGFHVGQVDGEYCFMDEKNKVIYRAGDKKGNVE